MGIKPEIPIERQGPGKLALSLRESRKLCPPAHESNEKSLFLLGALDEKSTLRQYHPQVCLNLHSPCATGIPNQGMNIKLVQQQ